MSENTTSVEGLVFTAKDETSNVTDKIGKSFERLHHAAEGAREKVGEFAKSSATGALASIGLGFGLHALFDKAKEVNLEMAGLSKKIGGAQFAFRGWAPGLSIAQIWVKSAFGRFSRVGARPIDCRPNGVCSQAGQGDRSRA